jgi:phage-related tail fiber protein
LPVPDTVAVHWLVWPIWTLDGIQETLTEVMVGDTGGVLPPIPPPPQAATNSDKMQITMNANTIRARAMNHLLLAVFGK